MANSTHGKDYHNLTSYDRRRMTGHALDWGHRPDLYKRYPQAESISLPKDGGSMGAVSLWDIVHSGDSTRPGKKMDLEDLAGLLGLSYGITASVRYPQETFNYRSAPSAGALYPCEIYIAAYDIEGLDPGLYYFSVFDFALKRIRSDDIAGFLEHNSQKGLFLSLFITGIPYRSAWKYRARAYRYVLLDTGHLLGNLALVLKALRVAGRLAYDFDDTLTGQLLGLDNRREAGVARLDAGNRAACRADTFVHPVDIPALSAEMLSASKVSDRETAYPEIERMLTADYPVLPPEVANFQGSSGVILKPGKWLSADRVVATEGGSPAARALANRRSSRNFIPREIPVDKFNSILSLLNGCLTGGLPMGPPARHHLSMGFIVGAVEGIAPGFYLLDPQARQYARIAPGDLTRPMASVCLDQAWLKNAGIHFLFMLNPGHLAEACGPRGYRYAMIQAGFLGQMIYLGATALGLGGCGIGAIYDNEAKALLGLNSGSALGYLVAAGVMKKAK